MVNHSKLTDHQIASAFGPTLSLIYKEKMAEINAELQPIYNHLDTLDVPRYTDFDRWFARETINTVYPRIKLLFESIEHINKIRRLSKKMKDMPDEDRLDVDRARAVPIESLYDFKKRGKNVSCPFHGVDKNPSMSLKNNYFYCFVCAAKGDAIEFFMRINKVTNFRAAVKAMNSL